MIRVARPAAAETLSPPTRLALSKRQTSANSLPAGDPGIRKAWANFLSSKPKDEVEEALQQYFHRKCAYCETISGRDIEHFYPKGRFPKRMFQWDNFLLGCKNCNNAKLDAFPLDQLEQPILLDPCRDDPLDYGTIDFTTGWISPRPESPYEEREKETRDLLQLNREEYCEERRRKVNLVLYLLAKLINESPASTDTLQQLREELAIHRPWLGVVRQLFHRPGTFSEIVTKARQMVPELEVWIEAWF